MSLGLIMKSQILVTKNALFKCSGSQVLFERATLPIINKGVTSGPHEGREMKNRRVGGREGGRERSQRELYKGEREKERGERGKEWRERYCCLTTV